MSVLILLLSVFSSDMLTRQSNTNPVQRITPPLPGGEDRGGRIEGDQSKEMRRREQEKVTKRGS